MPRLPIPVITSFFWQPDVCTVDNTLPVRNAILMQRVALCKLDELEGFLKTGLMGELRFPVSLEMWNSLPTNRDKLFREAKPAEVCYGIVPLVNCIVAPPIPTADTEDSFHHFWDTMIEEPLRFFYDGPWLAERNKSGEGSSSGTRPDKVARFGFNSCALWRGEEKGPITSGDPKMELISKLVWSYKHLPFLLAYYARAWLVTICALHQVEDPSGGRMIMCRDLVQFNTSRADDRLELVLACISLAKLLKIMADVCEINGEVSDMPLIRRASGKIIRPHGRKVEKTYSNDDLYFIVTAIYEATRLCPNVEHLLQRRDGERTIVVQRAAVAKPRNRDELIACLRCLCEALEWLHTAGFMHRDIRWENVLRDLSNSEKWVLVDLDEAIKSNEGSEAHRLNAKSHAPEMTAGPHDSMVDIWGIGYLLSTSNIILDAKLLGLMEKCLHEMPDQRPTATECLELLDA